MAQMSDEFPQATLTVEFCGLQVATLLERCRIEKFNTNLQFSPLQISYILIELPSGKNQELHVYAEAVHHGIHLLKKMLVHRSFTVVVMNGESDRLAKYYELKGNAKRGHNLIFPTTKINDKT